MMSMIPFSFVKACLNLDTNAFITSWVVLRLQCISQAGGQFEPISRYEMLCEFEFQPQCEQ